MPKSAVIDIGSNSVRLLLWQNRTLEKQTDTVRLGEGVALSGVLKEQRMAAGVSAVRRFYEKALQSGAVKIFVFATAAVRNAANGGEFADRVHKATGLCVDVLTAAQEAEAAFAGACQGGSGAVLDIGGASTELTVKENGKILYCKSIDTGAVTIYDACGRNKAAIEKYTAGHVKKFGNVPPARMFAVGGSATSLAAMHLGLKKYSIEKVDGHVLSARQISEAAHTLLGLSVEETARIDGIEDSRAQIIGGAAAWFYGILQYIGCREVTVKDADNLEGYLIIKGLV